MAGAVLPGVSTVDQIGDTQDRGDAAGFGVHIVDGADHRGDRGVGAGYSHRGRAVRGAVTAGKHHTRTVGGERRGEARHADALIAGVVAQRAAADHHGGIGRADVLVSVNEMKPVSRSAASTVSRCGSSTGGTRRIAVDQQGDAQ